MDKGKINKNKRGGKKKGEEEIGLGQVSNGLDIWSYQVHV